MRVVRKNDLVEIIINSWKFYEQGSRVAEALRVVAAEIRSFCFERLLCAPSERLPRIRFPLYHSLFIYYAENLSHIYVIYGSAGARRGIKVPDFDTGHYSATILSEPGDPYKGKGSLTFLYGEDEVGFCSRYGKSFLREDNFYGPDTRALLEIFLPPRWEQADFDIANAIAEHIKRQDRCITEIFERKGE